MGYRLNDSLALRLQDSATPDELIELTTHPSAVIRTNALFALLARPERDSLDLHLLVPMHFHDTATVELNISAGYPERKKAKVGEIFLMGIGKYDSDLFWMESSLKLPPQQKAWLDSVFLCSNTDFNIYKGALAHSWKPKESMYDCIRYELETGQDNFVGVFLAKYQREGDIELITSHLPTKDLYWRSNRWHAFKYFKHPKMFEFLKSELGTGWTHTKYLQVVAEYKNPESVAVFDSIYSLVKQSDKKIQWTVAAKFCNALTDNYDPVYADLLVRALADFPENNNFKIPNELWETHADTLSQLSGIWKNGGRGAKERATKMMPKLLEYLQNKDSSALFAEIVSRIKPMPDEAYVSRRGDEGATQTAYIFIYRSKNPYFIEPLFNFLKEEPLAKNRFFIAKILQTYGDDAVNKRITDFFKNNPELAPKLVDAMEGGKIYADFYYKANPK